MMRRRAFITLVGGAAAWPLAARAQQPERVRRIGALMPRAANDPESVARIASFAQVMHQLGSAEGRNLRIDTVWAGGSVDAIRKHSAELVADAPDVILADGGTTVAPLLMVTSALPIVFVSVSKRCSDISLPNKYVSAARAPARRHCEGEGARCVQGATSDD